MLFINDKDIKDLTDEIEEDFGLKPPKNDSKNNKGKKQTVEDRIINRCKLVQAGCSLALDQLSYVGSIKSAMECKDGKDFVTGEELSAGERAMCGVGAFLGAGQCLAKAANIGGFSRALIDAASMTEGHLSLALDVPEILMDNGPAVKYESEQIIDKFQQKNNDRNKSMSKSRSRSRSRNKSRSRSRIKDKSKNKKDRKGKSKNKKKK